MKYIKKGVEPEFLKNKKEKLDKNASYDDLGRKIKKLLREHLKAEQGEICCYCERRLHTKDDNSKDYHNEHIKPKDRELYPHLATDYYNIVCSCQGNLKKAEISHCGKAKDNWYDEQLFVSPLSKDCESKFRYNDGGEVFAVDGNKAAKTTIEKLNLNCDKLIEMRKMVLKVFYEEELSLEELIRLVKDVLKEKGNNKGKYQEFYTTIKYLFGKYIE
ncbi:MAG: retron system putative HNH endonuclease [Hyphomicrobiales bacterium]